MKNAISTLALDKRTLNCLRGAGINTLDDLLAQTENDLLKIPYFGRFSLNALNAELLKNGHKLYVKTEYDFTVSDANFHVRRCELKLKNAQDALDVAKAELAASQERLDRLLKKH